MRIQKFFTLLLSLLVVVTTTGDVFWLSNQVAAATTVYLVDREDDPSSGAFNCNDSESDDNSCPLRFAIDQSFFATDNIIIKFVDDLDSVSSTDNIVTLTNANGSGADDLDKILREDVSVTIDGENHVTITHDGTGQYDALFQIGDSSTNSTNNVIKNLNVEGFKNGIVIYGDNNTVQNVKMQASTDCDDSGQRGIALLVGVLLPLEGNNVLNNTISCFRKGIMAQMITDTNISGNIIRNNTSQNLGLDDSPNYLDQHPCYTAGIEIQGTPVNVLVPNNHVTNNVVDHNSSPKPSSGECSSASDFVNGGIVMNDWSFLADAHVRGFLIEGNHLNENLGDGMNLISIQESIIQSNNILERNGSDTPTSGDVTTDQGNGIALRCEVEPLPLGEDGGSKKNFIFRNNISHNADNGIFVGKGCISEFHNSLNIENTFLENSIYENGRNTGTASLADDGIGIDLQSDSDVIAFAYSTGNSNVSPNNGSDTGGNDMQDFPVITGASYNSSTNAWTVTGTVTPASSTLVELFQVGCSEPSDVTTCDIDDNDSSGLGFGSGRYFLGRTLSVSGAWTITVPSSAGFSGGVLTSTATTTTTDPDTCMAASTSATDVQTTLAGRRVCSTSEFSENFLAQAASLPSDLITFNKLVAPSSVAQGGTVSVILTATNFSDVVVSDSEITISDDLTSAQLSLNAGTCTWATGSSGGNCNQSGNNFVLTGFDTVGLSPGRTLTIQFTATVSASATLGVHTNTAGLLYTEVDPDLNLSASDDFTVTVPSGGSCGVINTNPDASFTIDGNSHTGTYTAAPHLATFLGTGTSGNAPLTHQWYFDSTSQGSANPTSINLISGNHTVTHIVTDCDGGIDTEIVSLTISSTSGAPNLTLSKSILPNTNLHTGDAVTVTIQANNPISTGIVLADIVLKDIFTALNQSVTSCRFEKNALPGGGSPTCTVAPDGSMTFPLTTTGLQPSETLYVQYTTTVTGSPGTYTNPVSYTTSNPVVSPAPAPASAQFTVVSSTPTGTCSGTANVDAEFSINGEPTPATMSKAAGTYTLTNDDTSGDGTVTYIWSINGVNQPENSNSLVRTLAPGTSTITLMKSDCNGSLDSDTLTLTIAGGTGVGSGGTFEVTKTVENPQTLYAVDGGSTDSLVYRITIKNNESLTRTYSLEDSIPTTFKDTVSVLDAAGGTNATVPGIVKVTNISLLPGETKTLRYSVDFKSANDFPLSLYSLDHNADPQDDSDFYADDVKDENIENDNNQFTDEDDITDAPDGKFVSLGEDGSIIVDVGTKKVIVDGEGDDFGLFTIDNHALDFDRDDEDVKVSVSQDGINYKNLSGDTTFDLGDGDLPWARYVKIEDNTNTSVTQSGAAGVDLDAVCLFNLGVAVTNQANVTMANAIGSASNTIYVNVSEAFDDPLTKSDCRETGTTITTENRQPRTVELPPPPTPYSPIPTPSPYFPPSAPVLPKTGTEALPLMASGLLGVMAWIARRKR